MTVEQMVRRSICGVALIACCVTVQAAPKLVADRAGASHCTIAGFLSDTDPKGADVRNAPRADAPVMGHLPPRAPILPGAPDFVGAEFEIIGSREGWLLDSPRAGWQRR